MGGVGTSRLRSIALVSSDKRDDATPDLREFDGPQVDAR